MFIFGEVGWEDDCNGTYIRDTLDETGRWIYKHLNGSYHIFFDRNLDNWILNLTEETPQSADLFFYSRHSTLQPPQCIFLSTSNLLSRPQISGNELFFKFF